MESFDVVFIYLIVIDCHLFYNINNSSAPESMNEHKEVNALSAKQAARGKYVVTAEVLAEIEHHMKEIMHRLRLPDGSPHSPHDVLDALRCILEDRTGLPSRHQDSITLHPYDAVPVPLYVWVRVAWMYTEMLGIKWQTRLALSERRIFYVGTLLLYTEEELTQLCNAPVVTDVKSCLVEQGLRLPTAQELASAKEAGFWIELPDSEGDDKNWNLRVMRELASFQPISGLVQLCSSRPGFWPWAKMTTLGDLLSKTAEELRQLWREYIVVAHVGTGNAAALPDETHRLLLAEAATQADTTTFFILLVI